MTTRYTHNIYDLSDYQPDGMPVDPIMMGRTKAPIEKGTKAVNDYRAVNNWIGYVRSMNPHGKPDVDPEIHYFFPGFSARVWRLLGVLALLAWVAVGLNN